jgi:hypothetical protein
MNLPVNHKHLVMKSPMKSIARIFMLCVALSMTGSLYARPYSLQRPHPPKKHKYYYYPRQNVYYDPIDHVYFVWERTYWKPVSYVPGRTVSFTYSNSPRFELWVASDHPYYYNVEHRRTYYAYRAPRPAPAPRVYARAEARPKPNVSFRIDINPPRPEPVYVEERVVVVREHDHGHHHPPGLGHGHGPGPGHHPGHGRGHGHH